VTQQQQEPNILPPSVQEAWDVWCDARINNRINRVFEEVGGLADEIGTAIGQDSATIYDLMEICKLLAADNAYVSGRIDQLRKDYRMQLEIRTSVDDEPMVARTMMIEEERTSKISQVVSVIDSILAH
jgi:hypothetical protein